MKPSETLAAVERYDEQQARKRADRAAARAKKRDAERAVVDAARAYAKYKPYDDDVDLKELGRALRASIEALERAEGKT
jgi:hypothetical protein